MPKYGAHKQLQHGTSGRARVWVLARAPRALDTAPAQALTTRYTSVSGPNPTARGDHTRQLNHPRQRGASGQCARVASRSSRLGATPSRVHDGTGTSPARTFVCEVRCARGASDQVLDLTFELPRAPWR